MEFDLIELLAIWCNLADYYLPIALHCTLKKTTTRDQHYKQPHSAQKGNNISWYINILVDHLVGTALARANLLLLGALLLSLTLLLPAVVKSNFIHQVTPNFIVVVSNWSMQKGRSYSTWVNALRERIKQCI